MVKFQINLKIFASLVLLIICLSCSGVYFATSFFLNGIEKDLRMEAEASIKKTEDLYFTSWRSVIIASGVNKDKTCRFLEVSKSFLDSGYSEDYFNEVVKLVRTTDDSSSDFIIRSRAEKIIDNLYQLRSEFRNQQGVTTDLVRLHTDFLNSLSFIGKHVVKNQTLINYRWRSGFCDTVEANDTICKAKLDTIPREHLEKITGESK